MPFEQRPQDGRLARKLIAELDAGEPRLGRLGEAGLERRVAAQFGQIVVAPGDRADPEAHSHHRALLLGGGKIIGGKAGLRG